MSESSYKFIDGFIDNMAYWENVLKQVKSRLSFKRFLDVTSEQGPLVVSNRPDLTLTNDRHQCHENCRLAALSGLGTPVSGWYLLTEFVFEDWPRGYLRLIHHSNLMLADRSIVNITNDEGRKHHLFLPDDKRSFDFSNNIGYNDRLVFGDEFMAGRDHVRAVPRNKVLYAVDEEYERDAQYEKFRIYQSKEEIFAAIPKGLSSKDVQRWILFKTNIRFGG